MAEITRTRPELLDHPGGLEEFAPRTEGSFGGVISPGWSSDRRPATTTNKPVKFTVPDNREEVLVKFLDDLPFAPVYQHWIATREGRRPYTCIGKDCPMCKAGDRAKGSDYFNVVLMGPKPELQVWYASPDPAKAIKARAMTPRFSPINKDGLYFAVSKSKGPNGIPTYSVDPVKEEELSEWGLVPLTKEQITEFSSVKHDASIVRLHTKSELQSAVDEYFD